MGRLMGPFIAVACLAGCVTDGSSLDGWGAPSQGSGIRWSGPASDPYASPFGGSYGRSPGYARSNGRTFQPSRGVVCDRATQTCYRGREIDASETRDYFGNKAARKADRVRDTQGTNRVYRVNQKVVCNRRDQVCYKNGRPDVSDTRDYFGKKAARRID
jgi:hypothetical protein